MAGAPAVLTPFRPLPLLAHPHLQTVVGHWLPRRRFPFQTTRIGVPFANGDLAMVHDSRPAAPSVQTPAVLLIHGMGGSHRSAYMVRLAARLVECGVRVFRIDLRGCGDSLPYCRQPSHGGCSDDLRRIYLYLADAFPEERFSVVGYSLGGNALLKLLAEADRPLPRLERAVAVNPPIDMERCSTLLRQPRNRFYERYFIYDLWRQARRRQRWFPHLKAPRLSALATLRRFDDLYTAPLSGFRDAGDYYAFASSFPHVDRIQTPTLLLTARDDPFIDPKPFEELPQLPNLCVEIVPGGGHLGYLGRDGRGGIHWLDERIARYLLH
jgi:predicted alpha/beta-fold hydrolase